MSGQTLNHRLRTEPAPYEGRVPELQIEAADALDARDAEIARLREALTSAVMALQELRATAKFGSPS